MFLGEILYSHNASLSTQEYIKMKNTILKWKKKTFYIVSEYNVGGGGGGGGGDFNLKKNFDRYIIKLNYAFI